MDQEIATLKLNINQLAGITGVHRQTVAARLKNVEPAPGSNSKLKRYLVTDILTELMIPTVSANIDDMPPSDRLSHWKAENERLKFEQDMRIFSTRLNPFLSRLMRRKPENPPKKLRQCWRTKPG